jgi:hypothetical protein
MHRGLTQADSTPAAADTAVRTNALRRQVRLPGLRSFIIRCGAVASGLFIALALAEGILRALDAAPTDGVATVTTKEFDALPGILSPGQSLIDRRDPRLPHRVTTNDLGYRGEEIAATKPPGQLRILFTGDSFAYGDFVDDDQTLPAQLERRLRVCGAGVRVINAGLGDATIVEEAHLIDRGLRLAPDLVILLFSENDVADLNRVSTWDRLAANRQAKSGFPLSILYPAVRRTAVWNFMLAVRARWRTRAVAAHTPKMLAVPAPEDSLPTRRLRESYGVKLRALRDTLARRGVPFVLAVYPSHLAVTHAGMRDQVEWITRTAADAGVFDVNLLPPLVESGLPADTLYLLPYDGHPSPRGYAIAAAYLADRLLAQTPLAGACKPRVIPAASEDRVNERRQRRGMRENQEGTEGQHHHDDR